MIVRRDNGKVVEVEVVKYGMLMIVLCDREGRIYDVWISFGCMHEVRAFRERKKRSVWWYNFHGKNLRWFLGLLL